MTDVRLPFSAVVGQEEAKLALLLNAIDPRIGGVLLRGEKGSAKSTLARGLAALLPGKAPFVELPVGATEDRLVGTLDIGAALGGGHKRFEAGLLASADGGVLYVDEVNLLPDHLVDVLLDVAASGVNRVEREGISHAHPSRFILVGSMNPEEGDLRPQLLDRFGLAVDVVSSADPAERAAALRRRLQFDADPSEVVADFAFSEKDLAHRLESASPAPIPEDVLDAVAGLCSAVGAEGLRADLAICRAAAALAGWEGRDETTATDVRRVAPLALNHRARRDPLDSAVLDRDRFEEAMTDHLGEEPGGGDSYDERGGTGDEAEDDEVEGPELGNDGRSDRTGSEPEPRPGLVVLPRSVRQAKPSALGRGTRAEAPRGRVVGDRVPEGSVSGIAVGATLRAAAVRRASEVAPEAAVLAQDLREPVREHARAHLVVVAVDASGSMGAPARVEAARAAVLGLLLDAYQRRDLVSLVSFHGERAEVLLRPTSSVEVARARLRSLATGGRTPLAAGLSTALEVAAGRASHRPLLVLITDGRATFAPEGADPVEAAMDVADRIRRAGVDSVVVDLEGAVGTGRGMRLGIARRLAERMGAAHVSLDSVSSDALEKVVRVGLQASQ